MADDGVDVFYEANASALIAGEAVYGTGGWQTRDMIGLQTARHFERGFLAKAEAIGRETRTMESGSMSAPTELAALSTALHTIARLLERQIGISSNSLNDRTTLQMTTTPDMTATLPIYSRTEADNFQE